MAHSTSQLLLSFILVLLVLHLGVNAYAENGIGHRWQGTAHFAHTFRGTGNTSGSVTYNWTINARWKEAARINVRNRNGRLTGVFYHLEDDHTTWQVTGSGIKISRAGCSVSEKVYSMQDEGDSSILYGWIYLSVDDVDPLKDVLPSGSYHVVLNAGILANGTIDIARTSCSGSISTSQLRDMTPLGFHLGQPGFVLRDPPDGYFVAEDIAPYVKGIGVRPLSDPENRQAVNELMSGEYENFGLPGTDVRIKADWELERKLAIDCTLEDLDRTWRPRDTSSPVPISVSAKLPDDLETEAKIRFTLYEVTTEKGDALNHGEDGEDEKDLRFLRQPAGFTAREETDDGYWVETLDLARHASVAVYSRDNGAWGKIKAEAIFDGEKYECQAAKGGYATIPVDNDENKIADHWEEQYGVVGMSPSSDTDSQPRGKSGGDGLSNYEEYRGFYVGGTWTDTNPTKPDVFIHDANGIGTGYFDTMGIEVHSALTAEEYKDHSVREVNFNRGLHTNGPQKGLYMRVEDLSTWDVFDNSVVGGATLPTVGTPNTITEILIDPAKMGDPATIAHELGHALNLMHHGAYIGLREHMCGEESSVAVWGGVSSGDVACLMRYDGDSFSHYFDTHGLCQPYPDSADHHRHTFCSSTAATGINAHPHSVAGDAGEFGACKLSFRVEGEYQYGE